jgi:hypothetical protein
MNMVTIRHPEAGEAQVPASAVPAWRSSGWELVEEPPAKKPAKKEEAPRGRRATNGDED